MPPRLDEWKRLYQRGVSMSLSEISFRLRQQATARLDLARYRLGMDFQSRMREQRKSFTPGRFFFPPTEVPRLCSLMKRLLPTETNRVIEHAERICRHQFDLLAYRNIDCGNEIDWHRDYVHHKRAPLKPWFRIKYLDFDEVGDSKIIWELNRCQHLVVLAKAYRLTGEQKFATELFGQWNDWLRRNPYPIGINWASSLEVAFRSLAWLWVYFLMQGSPAAPAGHRSKLLRQLAISARHIEHNLSAYFSPNTHLLGEGVALFVIGTLCPELQRSEYWQQLGWKIVQTEATRQVRPDGLHFEQSTYYHVYALDFFLHSRILAGLNGVAIPAEFDRTIEQMLEALCLLARSGPIPPLGDDDGGRLFDPRRNRSEHLLDPLATGAVLFRRGDFKQVAEGLREETLWLLGESGASEFDALQRKPVSTQSTQFSDAGLYLMADEIAGSQLVIDAGPLGAGTGGHGHADALSITASVEGFPLLIDSGTFEYVGENRERDGFRRTQAHSTLTVDGVSQAEFKGPFDWASLPDVRAEEWIKGDSFDYFAGSHDGYMRLHESVLHRRSVFCNKSLFWLVRDQAIGQGKHQLEILWHLAPDLRPTESTNIFANGQIRLAILSPEDRDWSQDVRKEDFSPAYGEKKKHTVVRFAGLKSLPTEFVTLIFPFQRNDFAVPRSFLRTTPASTEQCTESYLLEAKDEEHHFIFARGQSWELPPLRSDAAFVYWSRTSDKKFRGLVCCNATFLEADGTKLMSADRVVRRFEVFTRDGAMSVRCSEECTFINHNALDAISIAVSMNRA